MMPTKKVVGISRSRVPTRPPSDGANLTVKVVETPQEPVITVEINPQRFYETLLYRAHIAGAINQELDGKVQDELRKAGGRQREFNRRNDHLPEGAAGSRRWGDLSRLKYGARGEVKAGVVQKSPPIKSLNKRDREVIVGGGLCGEAGLS